MLTPLGNLLVCIVMFCEIRAVHNEKAANFFFVFCDVFRNPSRRKGGLSEARILSSFDVFLTTFK